MNEVNIHKWHIIRISSLHIRIHLSTTTTHCTPVFTSPHNTSPHNTQYTTKHTPTHYYKTKLFKPHHTYPPFTLHLTTLLHQHSLFSSYLNAFKATPRTSLSSTLASIHTHSYSTGTPLSLLREKV